MLNGGSAKTSSTAAGVELLHAFDAIALDELVEYHSLIHLPPPFFSTFAQVSRSDTERSNTSAPAWNQMIDAEIALPLELYWCASNGIRQAWL